MAKKTYFAGSVAATAGLLIAGTPALADTVDNDGINVANDNNASVLPIQLCGNNVAVLGVVANVLAAQSSECVNAPVVDHPSTGDHGDKPDEPEKPEKPDEPDEPEKPEKPDEPEKPDDEGDKPDEPEKPEKPEKPDDEGEKELPSAPTPVSHEGHAAVTG
ncbi:hypothetical protein SAMN04487905_11452 [Actinopolyspora xinjiangensis]|uniref:Small secreted domain n=1 Tax=Actinopolyspora xinjiangensis TaxID=405564 RepID=A0A1H0WRE2_9ACTN|nr:hypothetical protein [Actinopolyspora xinjiangensis]SDP93213.1 hypothetical protein SAMN04487905_11452 [Actinopolyspora xinjiangensis]